jgi:hypothetical protein
MTLEEMFLQKLAEWRPDSAERTLVVEDSTSGWKVAVRAESVDTLGCRLHDVSLTRTAPLVTDRSLADQAARLANLTGLLEPLRLVEVDTEHQQAQLRSQSPALRGGNVQYYEVLRKGDGSTSLCRYQVNPAIPGKRQAIPFTLTHEALAKLVADLASA